MYSFSISLRFENKDTSSEAFFFLSYLTYQALLAWTHLLKESLEDYYWQFEPDGQETFWDISLVVILGSIKILINSIVLIYYANAIMWRYVDYALHMCSFLGEQFI